LQYEALIFKEEYPNMEYVLIENPLGELIEVIGADLDFLIAN
jgi:hypothetical protein